MINDFPILQLNKKLITNQIHKMNKIIINLKTNNKEIINKIWRDRNNYEINNREEGDQDSNSQWPRIGRFSHRGLRKKFFIGATASFL